MSRFLSGHLFGAGASGGGGLVSTTAGTRTGAPMTWDGTRWSQGDYISFTTDADVSSGLIRFDDSEEVLVGLNNAANARKVALAVNNDQLFIGTSSAFTLQWPTIRVYAATSTYLGIAGGNNIEITSGITNIISAFGMVAAGIGATGYTSPYSIHGGVLITMTDADLTLAEGQYKYQFLDIDQTATTATRTVTVPNPASKAVGYLKDIRCFGDAVRTITIKAGAGTATADFVSGATGFVTGRVWVEPDIVRLVGATLAF